MNANRRAIYMYIYSVFSDFDRGFAYFNNNVDSKGNVIIRTAILYIYIFIEMKTGKADKVCSEVCNIKASNA